MHTCHNPKFKNFLGFSSRLSSGYDSSQYGEKNEMLNMTKIKPVKKTASFNALDARNHSPKAMLYSVLSSVVNIKVLWTDSFQDSSNFQYT